MSNLLTELNPYISSSVDSEGSKYGLSAGLLRSALYNTSKQEYMTQMLKDKIRSSNGRSVDVSAIVNDSMTVKTSLSYDIDANLSTTAKQRVVVLTTAVGFHEHADIWASNAVQREAWMKDRFMKADKACAAAIAENVNTALASKRTQVLDMSNAPSANYEFNTTDDSMKVKLAAQEGYGVFDDMITVMNHNNIDGDASDFNLVANAGIGFLESYKKIYGTANDKNLQADSQIIVEKDTTGKIANASGVRSTGYLMKNGAVSLIPVVPLNFEKFETIGNYAEFGVANKVMPITGMQPLLYREEGKSDSTSLNGSAMDKVIKHWVGFQYAIVTDYISDQSTDVNNILKVEFLNS